ncbi:MAG: TauD/TfdA family dioxygenase [SAR324 cluster bacterium]|nr:TauD/TfdA family dioxygenase [SAR324 cluster bacterium]
MDSNPFDLEDNDNYERWRDLKLQNYPTTIEDLLVEVNDPRELSSSEFGALQQCCSKANMALYAGKTGSDPDPKIPLSIAHKFGVYGINKNWLADENALTSLTVRENGIRQHYIPFTNRSINWHTDGYYNSQQEQVHSLLLHSVQRAASGGENKLLDHEIAYILLRDQAPEHVRTLMRRDALSIPPRIGENGELARQTETGPVFSVMPCGNLHMRYTIRKKHVIWADNKETEAAVSALRKILAGDSAYIFQGLLEPGMGLIGNNVLHTRTAFVDDEDHKRYYYRARYFERLSGTGIEEVYFKT